MMTGALQAHADGVKPLNDNKQTNVSETVKTVIETAKKPMLTWVSLCFPQES
jgi:hypothetical protein